MSPIHLVTVRLIVAFASLAVCLTARAETPREWIDAQTGHRVIRLSDQPGSESLYFHQNAFTPEGDKLLITTPAGISTVDLQTRQIQLIVPRGQFRAGGSSGIEMGRKTRSVYYLARSESGAVVRRTHIETGESRDLVSLPLGSSFNGITADESAVFGTQNLPPVTEGSRFRNRQQPGPRSMHFWWADTQSGEIRTFHRSADWLNHGQCSPTDPRRILFCHEGIWQDVDRVWTMKLGEEQAQLLHKRQMANEIAGHEFFGRDGAWVWYDLQTPRSAEFWLAGVNLKTGERVKYSLQRSEWSVHYNVSKDSKVFAGDGGGPDSVANHTPLPEKRRLNPPGNGTWIYLFRPAAELEPTTISGEPGQSGRMITEKLVDMSKQDYQFEPNVNFTPDGQWIVFRSNMHGDRHVYMVEVDRK